jgi:hypothetical protein|nr:MAG TPA: hypothetical protein [Caudoviricetes sp.]
MAEYHVGCGAFGIYAGTLNPPRKDGLQMWRQKSEVTEEAMSAVVQYIKQELMCRGKTKYSTRYEFSDGTFANLIVEIAKKGNNGDGTEGA